MVELSDCNKLCVFFLSVLGLWPYGSKKFRLFQNIFISICIWLSILAQILAFISMDMTLYRALRNLLFVTVCMGSLVKYHAIWYQANTVKGFVERIKLHWQTNNDVILQTMQKHSYLGKQLSTLFASFTYSAGVIMMLYQFSPIILGKITHLNESRRIKYPIEAEMFFDKEGHPIPATIVCYLWIVVVGATYIGTESLTIMICLHVASLFEVTSYHFQAAISIEVTDICIPRKYTNDKAMSYLIKSVIMHEETIQFCSDFNDYMKLSYTPLIIMGVTSLSINLFFLSQSVLRLVNAAEVLFHLLLAAAVVQYMFLINFTIQCAIDGAANVSITIYNTSWYETSVVTKKLLQMVILRSNKGSTFRFYNMFDASLRGFSVLFQTSLSYFMVLVSLQ